MNDRRAAAADSVVLGGVLALSLALSAMGGSAAAVGALAGGLGSTLAAEPLEAAWRKWRERLLGISPGLTDELYAAVVTGSERAFRDIDELWQRSAGREIRPRDPQLYATCTDALTILRKQARELRHGGAGTDGFALARALIGQRADPWAQLRARLRDLVGSDEADLAHFVTSHIPLQAQRRVLQAVRDDEPAWRSFTQLLLLDITDTVEGLRKQLDEVLGLLKRDTELDEYRLSVSRQADKLPYQSLRYSLGGDLTAPKLSTVYMRRTLEISGGPAQTPEQVLAERDDVVIVAEAGFGKSTLLRHMALLTARSGYQVPLLVPARALLPDTVSWEERLSRATGLRRSVFSQRPGPYGTWLVLVDGLDEIIEPLARADAVDELADYATRGSGRWRIFVTTRFSEDAERLVNAGFRAAQLAAAAPEDRHSFLVRWFAARPGAGQAAGFEQWIAGANLGELADAPLFLTIAAVLFEHSGQMEISSRWELLDRLAEQVVFDEEAERTREEARWLAGLERQFAGLDAVNGAATARELYQRRGELLEHLACWRQKAEPGSLADAALAYARDQRLLPRGNRDRLHRLMTGLLVRTGFIGTGPAGEEFTPEIMRQFLVARSFTEARRGQVSVLDAADLSRHGADPAWREVLWLLCEGMSAGVPVSAEVEDAAIDQVVRQMSRSRGEGGSLFMADFFAMFHEAERAKGLLDRQGFRDRLPDIAASKRYTMWWRQWAIEQLGVSGSDAELISVARRCRHEPEIVIACATALAGRDRLDEMLPDLLAASRDVTESRTSRIAAARALMAAGHDEAAATALITAGRHTGSSWSGGDAEEIARLLIGLGRTDDLRELAFDEAGVRCEDRVEFLTALADATGTDVSEVLRGLAADAPTGADRLAAAVALGWQRGHRDAAAAALVSLGMSAEASGTVRDNIANTLQQFRRHAELEDLARAEEANPGMRFAALRALVRGGVREGVPELLEGLARHDLPGDAAGIAELAETVGGPSLVRAFASNPELDLSVRVECACRLIRADRTEASAALLTEVAMLDAAEPRERLKAARVLIEAGRPVHAEDIAVSVLAAGGTQVYERNEALSLLARLGRYAKIREVAEDPLTAPELRLTAAEELAKADRVAALTILATELAHGQFDWTGFMTGLNRLVRVGGYESLRPIATDPSLSIMRRAGAAALLDDETVTQAVADEAVRLVRSPAQDTIAAERALFALYALDRTADLVGLAADPSIEMDLRVSAVGHAVSRDRAGHTARQIVDDPGYPLAVRMEAAGLVATSNARALYVHVAGDTGQPPQTRVTALKRLYPWSQDPAVLALLRGIAFDGGADPLLRAAAASVLAGTPSAGAALDLLDELSGSPDAGTRYEAAVAMLFGFGAEARGRGLRRIGSIAVDSAAPAPVRAQSVESIGSAVYGGDADAMALAGDVRRLALDRDLPDQLRTAAILALSGQEFAPGNIAVLRAIAESEQGDSKPLEAALEGLDRLLLHWLRDVRLAAGAALAEIRESRGG